MLHYFNRRLDNIEHLFGTGDYCECFPYGNIEPHVVLAKIWRKITGEVVDAAEFLPFLKRCTHEAQGKICNPRPIEFYSPPTQEEKIRIREKVERALLGDDYDDWKERQEEQEL